MHLCFHYCIDGQECIEFNRLGLKLGAVLMAVLGEMGCILLFLIF